jgi:hypothetical protein
MLDSFCMRRVILGRKMAGVVNGGMGSRGMRLLADFLKVRINVYREIG